MTDITSGAARPGLAWTATLLAVAFVGAEVAAAWPPTSLWGLHHLAFLGRGEVLAVGLTLAAIAAGASPWLQDRLRRPRRPLSLVVVGLLLAAFAASLWPLRVSHRLLGDGDLVFGQMLAGAGTPLDGRLSLWLLTRTHAFLAGLPGWQAPWSVSVHTGLWGLLGVGACLALARRLHDDGLLQALLAAALLLSAPLLLFYGYTELYAPLLAAMALFALCLTVWDGRHRAWLVAAGAVTALALALHPAGTLLLPPLAVAALQDLRAHAHAWGRTAGAAAAALLGGVAVGVAWYHRDLLSGPTSGLLSWAHTADVGNALLLGAPLQLAVAAILLLRRPSAVLAQPLGLVFSVWTATALGAVVVVRPILGRLDWDLLTLYSLPACVLCAWLCARTLDRSRALAVLWPVACAAALHVGAWLAVQASPETAVAAVTAMIDADPAQTANRRAKWATRLEGMGQPAAAADQYRRVLRLDPGNALAQRGLAMLTYGTTPVATRQAVDLLRRYVGAAPRSVDTRLSRALLAQAAGDTAEGVLLYAEAVLASRGHAYAARVGQVLAAGRRPERDRVILGVSDLVAAGREAAPRRLWQDYARRHAGDPVVARFTRLLEARPRRIPAPVGSP